MRCANLAPAECECDIVNPDPANVRNCDGFRTTAPVPAAAPTLGPWSETYHIKRLMHCNKRFAEAGVFHRRLMSLLDTLMRPFAKRLRSFPDNAPTKSAILPAFHLELGTGCGGESHGRGRAADTCVCILAG